MITLQHVYALAGLFLLACALQTLRDRGNPRRVSSALFWALLAVGFLAGDRLPSEAMGAGVVALALIAGCGGLRTGSYPEVDEPERRARAARHGHRLFLPALMISVLTLVGALLLKHVQLGGVPLLSPEQTTVVALGVACAVAFAAALWLTREPPTLALSGARRLLDAIGWAALLPLLLAVLGVVFTRAGVGEVLARLLTDALPLGNPLVALLAYALGMALFTMVMGNAFAAFPVISIGIGMPVLVG